ncbi:MAG: DUF4918 family protein [Cyclobacteriaceae bacterium]|nr:DUF4918 family protein [Cyclobacteriaceae bacterium]
MSKRQTKSSSKTHLKNVRSLRATTRNPKFSTSKLGFRIIPIHRDGMTKPLKSIFEMGSNKLMADAILSFYKNLDLRTALPKGVEVMNPYKDAYTFDINRQFYQAFYNDSQPRHLMLGINPGRFGSGTTGISFTDPIRLQEVCGIENRFAKKPELSSNFIYRMIDAYGGVEKFYKWYFVSAVSPLGFTKSGKNINYYDDKKLEKAVTPFVIKSINQVIELGMKRDKCFCIGEGKNYEFLTALNEEHQWFENIIPLAHPRFIMQYKRKQLSRYIDSYLNALS